MKTTHTELSWLDRMIDLSIRNRLLVVALAALVMAYGGYALRHLPVDVFPDLNRPTVTILAEVPGMAPEEVETLVAFPIETAMNGAAGVRMVRSSIAAGYALVRIEFGWNEELYRARQVVAERLAQVSARLPENVRPVLMPVSSLMGEIMFVGLSAASDAVSPMELREIADWRIRPRLLGVEGVSQVTVMGGEPRQYQVLVDLKRLLFHDVTLHMVRTALENANSNTTGGYMLEPYTERMIRNLARITTPDDLARAVIPKEVRELGPLTPRGAASIDGAPGVILALSKQPGADTIAVTQTLDAAIADLRQSLPKGVVLTSDLFRQSTFIGHAIDNIAQALRDGAILVVIVLFMFLLNLRTTVITLTAIPLSFVLTFIVLKWFGFSINTMTLGGLAVAIGELVDDAIVDVENVFRRLRENRLAGSPKPALRVVAEASKEVRGSIVFATAVIVLVFVPLFAMGGVEGRIFLPLGVAYIVSILASLVVSLTVTPALCALLLPSLSRLHQRGDGWLVVRLKAMLHRLLGGAFTHSRLWFAGVAAAFLVAVCTIGFLGREFLPEFNEGSYTINVALPPGTSLEESNRIGMQAEALLMELPEVKHTARRAGRADEDEHVLSVNSNEIEVTLHEEGRPKGEMMAALREKLGGLPGVVINIGQPISHRIESMTSGVRAQIAIKVFGPDLTTLRTLADQINTEIGTIEGVADLQVEQQTHIPQLHIRFDREKAARHGIMVGEAARHAQLALQGERVGQMVDQGRMFDIVLRLSDSARVDVESIAALPLDSTRGYAVPLGQVAEIEEAKGPNMISRENLSRRIVIQANASGRDVVSVVEDMRAIIAQRITLPPGYSVRYDGQYAAQKQAMQSMIGLGACALLLMVMVLYAHFRSMNLVAQVMLVVPLSLTGAVLGVVLSGGVMSIATMVGFVTLIGIASRNGIMMISHYLHLMREEGEAFTLAMIQRGTAERLVPVLMTAFTALLALLPIIIAAGEPGKEILHPVAVVIFCGLFTSTLLNLVMTPLVFWRFTKRNT